MARALILLAALYAGHITTTALAKAAHDYANPAFIQD